MFEDFNKLKNLRTRYNYLFQLKNNEIVHNDKKNITYTWFDKLPSLVLEKLLRKLNYCDLINFGLAYAYYQSHVVKTSLWEYFEVYLNECVVTFNDLFLIKKYLSNHIKRIAISVKSYKDQPLERLLEGFSDLRMIQLADSIYLSDSVVKKIGDNFPNLRVLKFFDDSIKNEGVLMMASCLCNLKEFLISSSDDISFGLILLLHRIKNLEGFGVIIPRIERGYVIDYYFSTKN